MHVVRQHNIAKRVAGGKSPPLFILMSKTIFNWDINLKTSLVTLKGMQQGALPTLFIFKLWPFTVLLNLYIIII